MMVGEHPAADIAEIVKSREPTPRQCAFAKRRHHGRRRQTLRRGLAASTMSSLSCWMRSSMRAEAGAPARKYKAAAPRAIATEIHPGDRSARAPSAMKAFASCAPGDDPRLV